MAQRTARRSRSLRQRFSRRGAQVALPLILALGGAIAISSAPASAATTPNTDTISIFNGSTSTNISLPAGTPDVATPLATALYVACAPLSSDILATQAAQVCDTYQFGPAADTVDVVGVGNSVGLILPAGFCAEPPNSGLALVAGTSSIALVPPGSEC